MKLNPFIMKWRNNILVAAAGFLLLSVVVIAYDPIYQLAFRLTRSSLRLSGFSWEFGMNGFLTLPASATPDELLRAYFPRNYPDRVLEIRHVPVLSLEVGFRYCSAILVEHDHGRWIYLFYRDRDAWRMKMFPA